MHFPDFAVEFLSERVQRSNCSGSGPFRNRDMVAGPDASVLTRRQVPFVIPKKKGGGRSRGFRTILLFRGGKVAFLVHGFAKRDRGNLREDEFRVFSLPADEFPALQETEFAKAQAT